LDNGLLIDGDLGKSHYWIFERSCASFGFTQSSKKLVLRWTRHHIQRELLKNWREGI